MRPYRSHKIPACDRCRRQKRRCMSEEPGQPCLLCKVQNVSCQYSEDGGGGGRVRVPPRRGLRGGPRRAGGARQARNQEGAAENEEEQAHHVDRQGGGGNGERAVGVNHLGGSLDTPESAAQSSMIVSPVITEDIQVLDQYMTPKPSPIARQGAEGPDPHTRDESVLYLSVPRRREGLAIAENPGVRQKTILSHLLRPFTDELVELYFTRIHPAFPFLDEDSFLESHHQNNGKLSPALLCEFYALSLTQWPNSENLNRYPKPDPEFIWNLAVEALQEDYLAPGLSTVYAAVLEMLGRPIFSVVGNAINNGRTVVLANSLGLHRNPVSWKRPMMEKSLRIRLWWAVLIQDRWSSFAHGISPSITNNHYDVLLPVLENLMTESRRTEERIKGAECFIQLCKLTEILGDVLPLVYDLKSEPDRLWRDIRRLETSLDTWDSDLPFYLRYSEIDGGLRVAGLSNLRLCYLAVRLLVARISLHAAGMATDIDKQESQRYHLSKLRRSAQDIVVFICSLHQSNLQEFWLPYTAHFLTFTVIILLRCTVESIDPAVVESCKSSLAQLWEKLHQAATQDKWDLANICIQRCQEPYSRVAGSFGNISSAEMPRSSSGVPGDVIQLPEGPDRGDVVPDLLPFANPDLSFESGDYLWDALWFGIDGLGNQSSDGATLDLFPT